MPVLVDGNNVMYALADAGVDAGRSLLCDLLGRYGHHRRVAVDVVFDGSAPPRDEARRIADRCISIHYSGGRTADDVLADLIETCSAPRTLMLVSTDRAVQRLGRRRRCNVVDSATFAQWLIEPPDEPAPQVEPDAKRHGLDAGQVDDWMEAFGMNDRTDAKDKREQQR